MSLLPISNHFLLAAGFALVLSFALGCTGNGEASNAASQAGPVTAPETPTPAPPPIPARLTDEALKNREYRLSLPDQTLIVRLENGRRLMDRGRFEFASSRVTQVPAGGWNALVMLDFVGSSTPSATYVIALTDDGSNALQSSATRLLFVENKSRLDFDYFNIDYTTILGVGVTLDGNANTRKEISLNNPSTSRGCDPSYPDVCFLPAPRGIDCRSVPMHSFRVTRPDPFQFDLNQDGYGCESEDVRLFCQSAARFSRYAPNQGYKDALRRAGINPASGNPYATFRAGGENKAVALWLALALLAEENGKPLPEVASVMDEIVQAASSRIPPNVIASLKKLEGGSCSYIFLNASQSRGLVWELVWDSSTISPYLRSQNTEQSIRQEREEKCLNSVNSRQYESYFACMAGGKG